MDDFEALLARHTSGEAPAKAAAAPSKPPASSQSSEPRRLEGWDAQQAADGAAAPPRASKRDWGSSSSAASSSRPPPSKKPRGGGGGGGGDVRDPATSACFPFLLRGECTYPEGTCTFQHVGPEHAFARKLRVGPGKGGLNPAGLMQACIRAPPERLLGFFDAWGDQYDAKHLASTWLNLDKKVAKEAAERRAWIDEHAAALARMRERTIDVLPRADVGSIVHTLTGAGGLKIAAESRFVLDAASSAFEARVDETALPQLASTLHLFVAVGHAKPALFAAAARAAERKLPRPKEGPLPAEAVGGAIDVLAAIAKAGHATAAAPLFGAVCRMLPERRLEEVKLRRLITLARALATAKAAGVRLPPEAAAAFRMLGCAKEERVGTLDPAELADFGWALASAAREPADARALAMVAAAAAPKAEEFAPRAAAELLWACGRAAELGDRSRSEADAAAALVSALATALAPHASELAPAQLAEVAWACAQCGGAAGGAAAAPALLDAVAAATEAQLGKFDPPMLTSSLWAFAAAGHAAPALFAAAAAVAERIATKSSDADGLARLAWAYAAADVRSDGALRVVGAVRARLAAPPADGGAHALPFGGAALRQLHQFGLWCECELKLGEAQLPLPPQLRRDCRDETAASQRSGRGNRHRRTVGGVGRALGRLQLAATEELLLAEGYAIDLALQKARVAIEVGGGAGGATLLKRRQLGVLGWRVVPVDTAAWEALGSDEAEGTWLEALL